MSIASSRLDIVECLCFNQHTTTHSEGKIVENVFYIREASRGVDYVLEACVNRILATFEPAGPTSNRHA